LFRSVERRNVCPMTAAPPPASEALASRPELWSPIPPRTMAVAAVLAAACVAIHPDALRDPTLVTPAVAPAQQGADPSLVDALATSRLQRSATRHGGERLEGDTLLAMDGALERAHVREAVELDASGRLAHAEIHIAWRAADGAAGATAHLSLDARSGTVTVSRDGRADARRVSNEHPWAYLPLSTPQGASISTPVAACVARRAAEAAELVRVFVGDGGHVTVPSHQLAMTDGDEGWVVLGDDLATFSLRRGRSELVALRVAALDLEIRPRR
jgi:hypothetical protein